MKQKFIVLIILILVAVSSSFLVLKGDGYFDNENQESKVLSVAPSPINQVALAEESTAMNKDAVVKVPTPVKKKVTPKKKVVKKKKVKKIKHKLNLAPPVITPATAPFSAKNRNN